MTTTEFNRPKAYAAPQPGDLGAGADIYRRLERRPRKSKLGAAVPIIVLTACSVGGAVAYLALTRPHSAPQPAPTATASLAPMPEAAVAPPPATSAAPAATPAASPAMRARPHGSLHVVATQPPRHVAPQRMASAKRTTHAATRAASVGEEVNTSATVPAASTPSSPPVVEAPPAQAAPATPPQ